MRARVDIFETSGVSTYTRRCSAPGVQGLILNLITGPSSALRLAVFATPGSCGPRTAFYVVWGFGRTIAFTKSSS